MRLTVYQGFPVTIGFRFRDLARQPIDLTGKAPIAYIRPLNGARLVRTWPDGWSIAPQGDPATRGLANLTLSQAEVDALPFGADMVRLEIELDGKSYGRISVSVGRWAKAPIPTP